MTKFVFLDFDGVLTNYRVEHSLPKTRYPMWSKLDPIAIGFFNQIHRKYKDVKFVMSTTWRDGVDLDVGEHLFYSMLYSAGFEGFMGKPWKVNPQDKEYPKSKYITGIRAYEIEDYLKENEHDDFLIFDDTDYDFDKILGKKRFVKTCPYDGVLHKHILNAKSIIGTWEKN